MQMGEELAEGRQVHLDGIGYFHPTLTCTEEIKEDTKRKNTKVRLKGIKFRADQELRSEIGNVKLKNIKHNGHSNKLSDEEIDSRLTIYFSQHHMMTRSDFQSGMRHDEIDRNGAYPPLTRGRKAKKHRITEPTDICAKRGVLRYNRRSYDVEM